MSTPVLNILDFGHLELYNVRLQNLGSDPASPQKGWTYFNTSTNRPRWYNGTTWDELPTGAGVGSVTSVSVATANGFAGTVASPTSTPAITITTSITGVLKGNGTAISAAVSGTDYSAGTSALATGILKSTTTTGALSIAVAGDFPTLNQNTTGTAASATNFTGSLAGDVSGTQGATAIGANKVTLGMLATLTANSFIGNSTGSTATPTAMSVASVKTLLNLAGTNSGDQTITLTGDVTGTGTGSFATTIASGAVTLAKQANLAANSFIGNNTGSAATPLALTVAQAKTLLAIVPSDITGLDTDGTLAANSDTKIATQKAVKTYVDTKVTSATAFQGAIDASTNPNYPAAALGQTWVISVAGKIGGASGVSVDVGDMIVATTANAGGTQASVGTNWAILEHNLVGALLSANNLSDIASASTARTNLGLGAAAVLGVGAGLSTSGGNLITTGPSKYTATIGDGSTTAIVVTHSLGTKDIVASVRYATGDAMVMCDITATSTTTATFTFAVAPASSSIKVVIIG